MIELSSGSTTFKVIYRNSLLLQATESIHIVPARKDCGSHDHFDVSRKKRRTRALE